MLVRGHRVKTDRVVGCIASYLRQKLAQESAYLTCLSRRTAPKPGTWKGSNNTRSKVMTSRELFLEKILISETHVQIVQSAGYQITSHAVAQLPLSPREQPAQIRNRPAAILSNDCYRKNILFFFKSSKISEKSSESLYNLGEKEITDGIFEIMASAVGVSG